MTNWTLPLAALLLLITSAAYAANHAAKLTDGQIAKILLTLNEGEVNAAKTASDKAKKGEVKDLAQMMMDEHRTNALHTRSVIESTRMKPRDSELSKYLKTEAEQANADLVRASSTTFDRTYVDQQVMMHQKMLTTINETLLPGVVDARLRSHLEKTRQEVTAHLDHVRSIQKRL